MSGIGIVVASHGALAQALINSAEMIVGAQDNVATVCLDPKDNLEACHNRLCTAIDQVQTEAGVLALIDLFGGTPGNAALLGLRERTYHVVAGVNLPMLLEVLMSRNSGVSVKELTDIALQAGQNSIIDVSARFEAQLKKES
jgi:mannose/fructose/sorbose-specific phosphotransferase system IIA component